MPPASPHPQSHDLVDRAVGTPYLRVGLYNCRSLHCCWMALAGASYVEPWTNLMATEVAVTLFHHKRAFHGSMRPFFLDPGTAFLELLCFSAKSYKQTNIHTYKHVW